MQFSMRPDSVSAETPNATQAAQSADSGSHVPNKRPRPVLSCLECRRKKLKCDRLLPCNQCTKVGKSANCAYSSGKSFYPHSVLSDASESETVPRKKVNRVKPVVVPLAQVNRAYNTPATPANSSEVNGRHGVIEDLQHRVERLEGFLPMQSHNQQASVSQQISSASHNMENATPTVEMRRGILSLRASRSRYFGPNHKLALLHHFDEAMDLCQMGIAGMAPIMEEFRRFQKPLAQNNKAIRYMPVMDGPSALAKMVAALPPRIICDKLVGSYVYNGEKTLRVLHLPSFLRECQQFWEDPETHATAFPGFIPQLYTAMLIGSGFDTANDFAGGLAKHDLTRSSACLLVAAWLDDLNWRQRTELSTMQTQVILHTAHKLCTSLPVEKVWNDAGRLVRSAISMGLHRDPAEFPSISIFEGELRRRLWGTIAEIDLQASLLAGCSTSIREGDFNCRPPANCDDLELYPTMTEYPLSKGVDEWSDCSCQVLLARALPLRFQALGLASNIRADVNYAELLRLGRKLEMYIHDLPAVSRFDNNLQWSAQGRPPHGPPEGPGRLVGQLLLDTYLRRVLVCLYRPFTIGDVENEMFHEGHATCLRLALVTLSRQDSFNPDVADLNVINKQNYWETYNIICKTDLILAALTVCLEIKSMGEAATHRINKPERSDQSSSQRFSTLTTWTKASLIRAVESTLSCALRRISVPGIDLRDALALSLAFHAAQAAGRSQEKLEEMLKAGALVVVKACGAHFGDCVSANGLPTQQNGNMASIPLQSPATDMVYDARHSPSYNDYGFPLSAEMSLGGFDLYTGDTDYDWSQPWS